MSLELAESTDTGQMVSCYSAFEESNSQYSRFLKADHFICLDSNCKIQLTLVNFGKSNTVQKPRFEPRHRTGHKHSCVMVHGTSIERAQTIKSENPNLSKNEVKVLSNFSSSEISIVDSRKEEPTDSPQNHLIKNQNSIATRSNTQGSGTVQKSHLHGTHVSSLGTVFNLYINNENQKLKSMDWPSYNKNGKKRWYVNSLEIDSPFNLKDITHKITAAEPEINEAGIYFGKAWVNFKGRSSTDSPNRVNFKFVNNANITTKDISWDSLAEFANLGLLKNMFRDKNNFPVEIVLCGHFYRSENPDRLVFVPRESNLKSWLFIPDRQ